MPVTKAGSPGAAPQAQRSGEGQGAALFDPRGMPGTGRGKRRTPTFAAPRVPCHRRRSATPVGDGPDLRTTTGARQDQRQWLGQDLRLGDACRPPPKAAHHPGSRPGTCWPGSSTGHRHGPHAANPRGGVNRSSPQDDLVQCHSGFRHRPQRTGHLSQRHARRAGCQAPAPPPAPPVRSTGCNGTPRSCRKWPLHAQRALTTPH